MKVNLVDLHLPRSVDVSKNYNKPHSAVITEAYGSGAKKILMALDKCNKVWTDDEKNHVAANVGLLLGGAPLIALGSLTSAATSPFSRYFFKCSVIISTTEKSIS